MSGALVELELKFLELPYESLRVRCPKRERALLVSLEEQGQQFPITVVPSRLPGFYVVIDGHARVRALRRLRADLVRSLILEVNPEEALLQLRVGVTATRLTPWEEGLLIRELVEAQGLSLETLAQRFGHAEGWVRDRLEMVRVLPDEVARQVQSGRIGTHIATRVLVPIARKDQKHAVILGAALAGQNLSFKEACRLHQHYRRGSPGIREELLKDPLRLLRAERAQEEEPQPAISALLSREEFEVLDRMGQVEKVILSLAAELRQMDRDEASIEFRDLLTWGWQGAREAIDSLGGLISSVTRENKGGGSRNDQRGAEESGVPSERKGAGNESDCQSPGDLSNDRDDE